MGLLIAIVVIILLSICISFVSKKKFEYILPLTAAGISLVLYVFSYFGIRPIGTVMILLALVVLTGYSIYKKIKSHDSLKSVLVSPGILYMVIMVVLTCIIIHGFAFDIWDEFSHWGLILKNLFASNGFGNLADSTTYFQSYPQGVSLFVSFFNSFSNSFSEPNALCGMLILSYSQMAILFARVRQNDWKKLLLITGILLILPLVFFNDFYGTVYVDAVMGLIFGNILFFNHIYRKKDLFYAIYMSLQFYLLANTKQIGIGLVAIATLVILIDFIYSKKIRQLKAFIFENWQKLLIITIPFVLSFLAYFSWRQYVKIHNISDFFQVVGFKISDLLKLFGGGMPEYRKVTIVNFVSNFFANKQYGTLSFSYFLFTLVFLIGMYWVYKKNKGRDKSSFLPQLSVVIGMFIYSGVVLFMYLFAFSEYEARNLASFDRYMSTYFLGLIMLSVFIIVDYVIGLEKRVKMSNVMIAVLLLVLLCIAPLGNLIKDTVLSPVTNSIRRQMREPYDIVKKYSDLLNPKTDRIYIVSQGSAGADYWILRYDFTPVQVSPNYSWSLGAPYSSGDIWTKNKTVKQWSQELQSYTYVYINKVDERFINDYGELFENRGDIASTSMFRVEKMSGEKVILKIISQKSLEK